MRPDAFGIEIKTLSWTENTSKEVDFLIHTLKLDGSERVLDLACGFGRHALEFARRGFSVVGVDISPSLIADAISTANQQGLMVDFICGDIRNLCYENQFDVILNLADGAIGYLENDAENLKIFNVISRALKPGGKHFIDICNAEYAEKQFPRLSWEIGENARTLSTFGWEPSSRRMAYGEGNLAYGKF